MKKIVLLILLFPIVNYANNLDLYFMGGVNFPRISNNSYVRMNQYMVNEYNTQSNTEVKPILGLGVAHTVAVIKQKITLGVGLSVYYANLGKISGIEYPFINDGIYDSLNYHFYAQSVSTMLESRLTCIISDWQPYLIAGIGLAWNSLYSYSETPTIPSDSAAAAPNTFANYNNTAFAYEIGVGLQKQIYRDIQHQIDYSLSIDYRYLNFGLAQLSSSGAPDSQSLQVSHLDTQALMLSLKMSV